MTSGGCEVDIGRVVPSYTINHRAGFSPVKLSTVNLGSWLYCQSTRWWCYLNVDPTPPTSTSCPPDVIHVIVVPRSFLFFTALPLHVLYWTSELNPCICSVYGMNQRTKTCREGQEMRLYSNHKVSWCINVFYKSLSINLHFHFRTHSKLRKHRKCINIDICVAG